MDTRQSLAIVAALLMTMSTGSAVRAAAAAAAVEVQPPVRIEADGKVIDTGHAWGHSSPCVVDLDGDKLDDLLLGDFSGKFRIYRNVGKPNAPKYEAGELLQAGGVTAEVNI